MLSGTLTCAITALAVSTAPALAEPLNPSFEDRSAWTFTNDADAPVAGGEAGWTWTSIIVPLDIISLEPVFATDGDQFAMTYAGGDTITQELVVDEAGLYELTVDFNGIFGRRDSPVLPGLMVDGEFQLRIGSELSDVQVAASEGGWSTFSFVAQLNSPGTYQIGIENTARANYAIAYDNVRFELIPTPGSASMIAIAGVATLRRRR